MFLIVYNVPGTNLGSSHVPCHSIVTILRGRLYYDPHLHMSKRDTGEFKYSAPDHIEVEMYTVK